jgi:hypothetical protein
MSVDVPYHRRTYPNKFVIIVAGTLTNRIKEDEMAVVLKVRMKGMFGKKI